MKNKKDQLIKSDCRRYMRASIGYAFFHRLMSVASPLIASWLIGDMTNYLLTLDINGVKNRLIPFICAVFSQIILTAVLGLGMNLMLTKQGFSYDEFLMKKFIRLPLKHSLTEDSGSVMERLEEDSAAFCWNQMIVCAYPGAIMIFIAVFFIVMHLIGSHILFTAVISLFALLPVMRSAFVGRKMSELKRRVSEYNEERKQMEQELFSSRFWANVYSLQNFFVKRLDKLFRQFLDKNGMLQASLEAGNEVLDFLCGSGIKIAAALVGALLIASGRLSMGTLLSGILMIPTITQCCQYIKEWITEMHMQSKLVSRLFFFYEEESESSTVGEAVTSLELKHVTFAYPTSDAPVLNDISFYMSDREVCHLKGHNGTGKTTILALLAGLYEPQKGQVCGGVSAAARRRSTSVQEQEGTIFSGTVWENLFLSESKKKQAGQLLAEMGLKKPLDYETTAEGANLSPGERKKILLVRAILRDANFLILDEPLNHLDEQGKLVLFRQIKVRGKGVLFVSHQELPISELTITCKSV